MHYIRPENSPEISFTAVQHNRRWLGKRARTIDHNVVLNQQRKTADWIVGDRPFGWANRKRIDRNLATGRRCGGWFSGLGALWPRKPIPFIGRLTDKTVGLPSIAEAALRRWEIGTQSQFTIYVSVVRASRAHAKRCAPSVVRTDFTLRLPCNSNAITLTIRVHSHALGRLRILEWAEGDEDETTRSWKFWIWL